LIARKDKYYFSIFPEQVRQLPDEVRAGLDADYCLNKARQVLANRNSDLDSIDWALHLADLTCVLRPKNLEPRLLAARARLWKGERDEALRMLEDLREAKPEKMSGADEDAWYRTHQLLGDLYLNEYSRPDLAVPCYLEFRKSTKSGADTMFKLGQAYENLGDPARAAQCYEHVTGYTEHPRFYEAQEALRRVKGG
jgi:tetratricopeptide (TPR) repeat protein